MAEKKPFWKNPWLWGVVALIAMDSLFRFTPLLKRIPDPPAVIATLPDFALTRSDGAPFTRADLADAVHLAGFVEAGAEPGALIGSMYRLEAYLTEQAPYERYGDELKLMLIHPGAASPEALATSAADKGLELDRWTLLVGDAGGVIATLSAALAESELSESPAPVAIIDGDGGVRGFYDATVEEGREEAFWRGMRTLESRHSGGR